MTPAALLEQPFSSYHCWPICAAADEQEFYRMSITRFFFDISKYFFLSDETGMATFHISKEIFAPLDDVWNLVSDVDREPEFWHGTKSVKNIQKEGNVVERETVIAFRNAVCKEIVTLDAKNAVKKRIIDGPIIGTKDIILTPIG